MKRLISHGTTTALYFATLRLQPTLELADVVEQVTLSATSLLLIHVTATLSDKRLSPGGSARAHWKGLHGPKLARALHCQL